MAEFWGALVGAIVGVLLLGALLLYIDRNDK